MLVYPAKISLKSLYCSHASDVQKKKENKEDKKYNVLIKAIISFPLGRLDKGYNLNAVDMYYILLACFISVVELLSINILCQQ